MGMNKYDRMLHILNLLRTRKNLNADRIAEECNCTERTIYRDLLSLSEMNIPIYYDNGYKLASDNFLPPLNFSFEEYQLLKLALESSPLIKTEKYQRVYHSLKAKIENCLSEQVVREKKYSPKTVHIDISDGNHSEKVQKFYESIEKAISSLSTISMEYESINSGVSQRKVDPYFIIFRGRAFYFVGYCHMKKDYRTFRINRIIDISLTKEHFVKKDDISPETYFEGSWSVYSGEPIEVEAIFKGNSARVIKTTSYNKDEKVEPIDDETVRYTVTVNGLEEIQRWLLGFGDEVEVVSPVELKENLYRVGYYLKNRYSPD